MKLHSTEGDIGFVSNRRGESEEFRDHAGGAGWGGGARKTTRRNGGEVGSLIK